MVKFFKIINSFQRIVFLCLLCFIFKLNVRSQVPPKQTKAEVNISDTFPTPPENRHMLFYIQRTSNLHTIIYEINYNKDSTINEQEPVKIYWIRYGNKGEIIPLNSVQRKFAYGVTTSLVDHEKKTFKVNLVSYKKIDFYLMKSKHDKYYHAFVNINGKMAVAKKVFLKIDGGSMFDPNVVYIELTGKDYATGKKVIERFKP